MTLYLWLQAFHIIAVIAWFAGIFYLPRLFVYHAAATDQISQDRFLLMETKLYRIIMNPSMTVTLVLGVWMLIERWQAYSGTYWLWLKIALVVALVGYHHVCLSIIKAFERGEQNRSEKYFRVFNEVPVFILVPAVLLVVIKPF